MVKKVDPAAVAWGPPPDDDRRPPLRIRRARPDAPVKGLIVSPGLVYVATHYLDDRTTPHTVPAKDCAGCRSGQEPRGLAYLAILCDTYRTLCLAEVTDRAIRYCPALSIERGKLRGRRLTVTRQGRSMRSPLSVVLGNEFLVVPAALPSVSDDDIKTQLLHIWGAPNRKPDADDGPPDINDIPA